MSDEQKVAAVEGSKEEAASSNKTQCRGSWYGQVLVICYYLTGYHKETRSWSLPSRSWLGSPADGLIRKDTDSKAAHSVAH